MKIYRIKLKNPAYAPLGFGITAFDWNDAASLLSRAVSECWGEKIDAAAVESATEITSEDELDQSHVVPNMGVMLRRGVWFPNMPGIA